MKDNLAAFVDLPDGTHIMFKGEVQIVLGKDSDGSLLKWLVEQDNKTIFLFENTTVSLHH